MKSNFIEWNTEDVINWIRHDVKLFNCNLELIKSHEINGRDLIDLNEDNLKEDLKILKLHDRKNLMRKICELMRNLVEFTTDENSNHEMLNEVEDVPEDKNFEVKTIKIKFQDKTLAFKCANNIKVEHIIKECIDVFDLNKSSVSKFRSENLHDKELKYAITDFYLSDKSTVIYPKENYICDIMQDYYNNDMNKYLNRNEGLTFYLNLNKEEENTSCNISLNNEKKKNSTNIFIDYKNKDKLKEKDNLKSKNIQMNTNENSYKTSKPKEDNNYYKDFSITETAVKNQYVYFEALDNLEKNGYSFINKKLNNHLNKTNDEKVTINSFYNISNLNNFNEKSLKSNISVNSSHDPKITAKNGNMKFEANQFNKNEFTKNVKFKVNKDSEVKSDHYSRKLEFDEISQKDMNTNDNIVEIDKISSKEKIELDEYMKILSYRTGLKTPSDNLRENNPNLENKSPISINRNKGNLLNKL